MIAACLSPLPACAQDEAFDAARQVPASVHTAISGGFWTVGEDEGFFRVVVIASGVEHVAHRLYIQWLRSNADTQDYELLRTVDVKELNLGPGHVLSVRTAFGDVNAFEIKIAAVSRGGETKHFAITAKGDGTYLIQP